MRIWVLSNITSFLGKKFGVSQGIRAIAFTCALGIMAACSSTMHATNVQAVKLDGNWVLDRQLSEDIPARLKPMLEKKEKQWRKMERRFEESETSDRSARTRGDMPPERPDGSPESVQGQAIANMRWMQGQRQRESHMLVDAMLPANEIAITQTARDLRFVSSKSEGTRTFVAGGSSSLFSELGGFQVTSGWDKGAFVIHSRGTDNGISKSERYTIVDGGAHLEERLEVKLPTIGKQTFKLIYRRS